VCRSARIVVPGMPHHVTQRGNFRQPVFATDEDRVLYLRLLRESADRSGVRIWAWCLMTNHSHVIAVPDGMESLAWTFGRTHAEYARHANSRQGRSGHLWQARFHSCLLDDSHLRTAIRYVELNPVRAGLVRHAQDYEWSSARARLRNEPSPLMDDGCPIDDTCEEWRQFLEADSVGDEIRVLRAATRTGWPAAGPEALAEIERATGRVLHPRKRGRRPGYTMKPAISAG